MMRKSRRSQAGTAAIEFALLAMPVVMLIGGILEYGWFFFQQSVVMDAARAAVRVGSMTDSANDPGGAAVAEFIADLDAAGIAATTEDVTTTFTQSGDANVLTLQASVNYVPMLGILPSVDALMLNARVSMVHEFPPE